MKIANTYSPNFGKEAILSCNIIKRATQQRQEATLYKYDAKDYRDTVEIDSMEQIPLYVRRDFINENFYGGGSLIYVLQDNKTKDVISYAQTTRHIGFDKNKTQIAKTHIDEIEANYSYINASEPLVAGITSESSKTSDERVLFAIRKEDVPSLKSIKLSETDFGELYIPRKRYNSIMQKAQERSQIEYFG